jgi:hypothetical protein
LAKQGLEHWSPLYELIAREIAGAQRTREKIFDA